MSARTVLVVDSSPLTARRVQDALRGTGYVVVIAGSLAEATSALEGGEMAVALVALTFPGGNGYDLARLIKERSPEAVVFLLCGGFEVYHAERAAQVGAAGRLNRPFTVDALVRLLEGALGPLAGDPPARAEPPPPAPAPARVDPPVEPKAEVEAIQNYEGPIAPAEPTPRPAVGDERVATFLPREWRTYPLVRVDPEVVGPALERAILEVLPEVVEAVLARALERSPAFRDLVEVAVDEAVRTQIGPIARRVVRERLAEIEAGGED